MLNRIFKQNLMWPTGLSYAVSTLGKSHNSKAVSLSALSVALLGAISFAPNAEATCPTPSAGQSVVQTGETCSYGEKNYSGTGNSSAVTDIRGGGIATFTANDVQLHKKRGGTWRGDYAAIFLRPDANLTNAAVFEGNVDVKESKAIYTRDIIVGGGSNLHIKGNLKVAHNQNAGAIFSLNTENWKNTRTDTKMAIDGEVTINAKSGSFIRMGTGEYTFAKDVIGNFETNGGIPSQANTSGKLTFNGSTTINNETTFLDIAQESTPTISFNKLTITNNADKDIFSLKGGTTSINGDSQFNTPNADAIKLYANATFNNDGTLTATTKDGVVVHAVPEAGTTATFNNRERGVISGDKPIATNDGAGILSLNNAGNLTSLVEEIFKNTTSGTISATNTGTLTGFLNSAEADTLNLVNEPNGVWNNTKNSSLDKLVNAGTINFVAPADKSHLTISTDTYTGGGTLVMNTLWDDNGAALNGTSTSDKLKIKTIEGEAVTTVQVVGNKIGSITEKEAKQFSLDVIEVENSHNGNLFVGTVKTNSPQEAQLTKEGNNYRWTLEAKIPDPVTPKTVPIISQPVVGYVQMPFINRQMGFAQLGKLHERVGEQRNLAQQNATASNQVWGRAYYDSTDLQGNTRFGAAVKSGFVQFGRDVHFKLNEDKSQQHTGLTFTYGWADSQFFDKYRAENVVIVADKFTGKAKSKMLSLGAYHTYYNAEGAYVDLVGQVSWLQNRYHSQNTQAKQQGYGFGASVEVGKPFPLLNPQVTFEPQAQLSYQSIWLNGFKDGVREVKKLRQDSLIARLGARVNWSANLEQNSPQVYFTTNLMQTLTGKGSKIQVGDKALEEGFGDLAVEFGIGTQYPINQSLSLYADLRHVISVKDHNRVHRSSDLARKSYNGRIGVRYSW